MNIAVLVKMVPDTESRLEVRDGVLDESGFKYMVNPYDEFAVEQAVQFREAGGGKVTLVALFSEASSIDTDLRKMLAIGCDEVLALRDRYHFKPDHVFLMPEGTDSETLREREQWLAPLCVEHGFRMSDRLHIHLFGDTRGT